MTREAPSLTDDELGILLAMADGSAILNIAAEMGLSYNALNTRLHRMREKFEANTNEHMIALAYHKGILSA